MALDPEVKAKMDAAADAAHDQLRKLAGDMSADEKKGAFALLSWIASNRSAGYKRLLRPLLSGDADQLFR